MARLLIEVRYTKQMIPVGYMLKTVVRRPQWMEAESIADIYSVSDCISNSFADYIKFQKHNGYWFFDSPQILRQLTETEQIDASQMTMFYYEVYATEYNDETKEWLPFAPDTSFLTIVVEPQNKRLEGFDVTTFSSHSAPECSPLSCCSLATKIPVNEHCLFNTFAEAKCALEEGKFSNSEPGPFRIFAVYKIP